MPTSIWLMLHNLLLRRAAATSHSRWGQPSLYAFLSKRSISPALASGGQNECRTAQREFAARGTAGGLRVAAGAATALEFLQIFARREIWETHPAEHRFPAIIGARTTRPVRRSQRQAPRYSPPCRHELPSFPAQHAVSLEDAGSDLHVPFDRAWSH